MPATKPLPLFGSGASSGSSQQQAVSGRDQLKQALKDEPAAVQTFALNVYDHIGKNYVLANFYKQVETTLAVVETRKQLGALDEATLIARTPKTSDLVDQAKAKKAFYDKAMDLAKSYTIYTKDSKRKMTEQEREQVATRTADKATAELVNKPGTDMNYIDRIFMKVLMAEEAAITQPTSKQQDPTAKETGQQTAQPKQTAQQQQKEKEQDNELSQELEKRKDEAVGKAKKGLGRKLKGLFGK